MTNNDELWEKLEEAESDELALNGNEVSNQLRHLADNEIDSDSFAVVTENYNGSEVEFERPITDLAIDAAEVIDALLAEREADKKRIAELEATAAHSQRGWNEAHDQEARAEAAEKRIAELDAISSASEKLVRCKGRYHSEQNYRALAALLGVTTPELPPLEGEVRAVSVTLVRYDLDMSGCDSCGQDCGADMSEEPDGDYVLFSDIVERLAAAGIKLEQGE